MTRIGVGNAELPATSAVGAGRPDHASLERCRAEQDLASLADGSWQRHHARLLSRTALDCGYRLVVRGGWSSGG
jgi:hypothetical protein